MPTIESRLFISGPLHGQMLAIKSEYFRVPYLDQSEFDIHGIPEIVMPRYADYRAMHFKTRILMILEGMTKDEVLEKVVEMLP